MNETVTISDAQAGDHGSPDLGAPEGMGFPAAPRPSADESAGKGKAAPILFLQAIERHYSQGEVTLEILKGAELAIWPGQAVALVAGTIVLVGGQLPDQPAGIDFPQRANPALRIHLRANVCQHLFALPADDVAEYLLPTGALVVVAQADAGTARCVDGDQPVALGAGDAVRGRGRADRRDGESLGGGGERPDALFGRGRRCPGATSRRTSRP